MSYEGTGLGFIEKKRALEYTYVETIGVSTYCAVRVIRGDGLTERAARSEKKL